MDFVDALYVYLQEMNYLAKHFFEYQSFNNLPHVAVQLHKPRGSEAGSSQSASWAPKRMVNISKNEAAPGARAQRNNKQPKTGVHQHGSICRHDHRQWGEQPREVKAEKAAPHKDPLTKFFSNEENTQRNAFECEFEDRILQVTPETLPERLSRSDKNAENFLIRRTPANDSISEVLLILTYAPQVQFVTATVKKAKALPYNNNPFARVMLFERRHLIEQKQTTVTPISMSSCCIPAPLAQRCSAIDEQTDGLDLPSTSTSTPQPSSHLPRSGDATFSESFLFHMTPQMLDRCHIVIEMFDTNAMQRSCGTFSVGYCVIGPLCTGAGSTHWLQMVRKSSMPVCMWHPLQPF